MANLALERERAHAYLDQLPPAQLSAVSSLLESMVDPVAHALSLAPVDEEPLTDEEVSALREAREWLKHNQGIPHEQVLAELGMTREEIDNYRDPA